MRLPSPFYNSNAVQLSNSGLLTNSTSKSAQQVSKRTSTQSKSGLSFSATIAKAQAKAAATQSSANSQTASQSVVHTPFGDLDPNSVDPVIDSGSADWDPWRCYFVIHSPGEYMNNPTAVAEFGRLYGAQALAILKNSGKVPENIDPNFVSTAANRAFYKSDGTRAYYTVADLIGMTIPERSQYVTISTQDLLALEQTDPNHTFPVTGTPTVWSGSQSSNGGA